MNRKKRLRGWLDMETTGFADLHKKAVYDHKVLEMALIATDHDFNEIARLNLVIKHDLADVLPLCDDVVLEMHRKNGLFKDVETATITMEEAEKLAIQFLADNGIAQKASPLTGNGIHFDREFLEVHMPLLNEYFHYRNLDISGVKEYINTLVPGLEPEKVRSHRAMDDILESIAEAKHYRTLLLPGLLAAKRMKDLDDCLQP